MPVKFPREHAEIPKAVLWCEFKMLPISNKKALWFQVFIEHYFYVRFWSTVCPSRRYRLETQIKGKKKPIDGMMLAAKVLILKKTTIWRGKINVLWEDKKRVKENWVVLKRCLNSSCKVFLRTSQINGYRRCEQNCDWGFSRQQVLTKPLIA